MRAKIEAKMIVLQEHLVGIRELIKQNSKSKTIPGGLLTRGEQKYLDCLEIKKVELEELLRSDEAHWAEFQEMSRR